MCPHCSRWEWFLNNNNISKFSYKPVPKQYKKVMHLHANEMVTTDNRRSLLWSLMSAGVPQSILIGHRELIANTWCDHWCSMILPFPPPFTLVSAEENDFCVPGWQQVPSFSTFWYDSAGMKSPILALWADPQRCRITLETAIFQRLYVGLLECQHQPVNWVRVRQTSGWKYQQQSMPDPCFRWCWQACTECRTILPRHFDLGIAVCSWVILSLSHLL